MTSRDEALKLARMHVSGEAYGRLVAGDAYVLARTLIAEAVDAASDRRRRRRGWDFATIVVVFGDFDTIDTQQPI